MLFQAIRSDGNISPFLGTECSENGVSVNIENRLNPANDYLIIKVDDYYNSINIANRPPSPDCLVIVKCAEENSYKIYIVELKDINSQKGFDIKNIREKFSTCINDFMKGVLDCHLSDEALSFTEVNLLFVSNPYNESYEGERHLKSKSTKIDSLLALNTRPFRYDGKRLGIQHKSSSPTITPC
mgnify:CR=1 FL=1